MSEQASTVPQLTSRIVIPRTAIDNAGLDHWESLGRTVVTLVGFAPNLAFHPHIESDGFEVLMNGDADLIREATRNVMAFIHKWSPA